jgi:hypothetical protein
MVKKWSLLTKHGTYMGGSSELTNYYRYMWVLNKLEKKTGYPGGMYDLSELDFKFSSLFLSSLVSRTFPESL